MIEQHTSDKAIYPRLNGKIVEVWVRPAPLPSKAYRAPFCARKKKCKTIAEAKRVAEIVKELN